MKSLDTRPLNKVRRTLLLVFGWSFVAVLVGLLLTIVMALAENPVGAGDQVIALERTAKSASYVKLLGNLHYSWWLLAQLWLLKLLGVLTLSAAKMLSGCWLIAGIVFGVYLAKRFLHLGIVSCAVFVVALGGSVEILSWAESPHSVYMANFALGGLSLAIILSLGTCDLRPSAMLAVCGAFGFAFVCLFSPVQGVLIGSGLLVVLVAPRPGLDRLPFRRRLLMAVAMGLPAAFICVMAVVLFPHPQIGNPASYAYPYLYNLSGVTSGPVSFVLSRAEFLLVQVYSVGQPRNGGLGVQGVLMLVLAAMAVAVLPMRSTPRSWRLLVAVILVSLVPTAALALASWYPFGYVRYEFYAVIPIALLPAVGASAVWRHVLRPLTERRAAMVVLSSVVLGLAVAVVWSWSGRLHAAQVKAEQARALLQLLDTELNTPPTPAFVTDFWSNEIKYFIQSDRQADLVIPRPVLVAQRLLSEDELASLRSVLSEHDRAVVLLSGPTQAARYNDLMVILRDLDYVRQEHPDVDTRLTIWSRPESAS